MKPLLTFLANSGRLLTEWAERKLEEDEFNLQVRMTVFAPPRPKEAGNVVQESKPGSSTPSQKETE